MARKLDIGIVGYGTAGQAATLFLQRAGHRVTVFERAPAPGPVGAGLLLQPTGLAVLQELGLYTDALACGARVDELYGETPQGRVVMDMAYQRLDPDYFGLGIQRGALFSLLHQGNEQRAQVRTGIAIVSAEEDGRFLRDEAGNRHGPYDLVLAADGSGSALRRSLLRPRRDAPYPWGAVWCLCPDPQRRFDGRLSQRYRQARYMAGVLPVGQLPAEDAAQHRVSFFWSLPQAGFAAWQQRGLDPWREEVAAYWPEVAPLLAHLRSTEDLARASYRDVIVDHWHQGRVAFLGDAAHAMSPQLGQGANLALMDAQVLAKALREHSDDLSRALPAYSRERKRHVNMYQFISRWLTPLFQSDLDAVAAARDLVFGALCRYWPTRPESLKVLAGVKLGLLGQVRLKMPRV